MCSLRLLGHPEGPFPYVDDIKGSAAKMVTFGPLQTAYTHRDLQVSRDINGALLSSVSSYWEKRCRSNKKA